jgi:hypothetical protein
VLWRVPTREQVLARLATVERESLPVVIEPDGAPF